MFNIKSTSDIKSEYRKIKLIQVYGKGKVSDQYFQTVL